MATIEEKLTKMLFDSGMWEDQCKAVMEAVKADDINEPMAHRWGEPVDSYPTPLLSALWRSAKRHALEYIDANCPQALARFVLAEDEEH